MRNGPQLITYADRLGGDLQGLLALLDGPFQGAFTGVHVLPFFVPIDGADAGFDPSDHTAVDPRVGSWDDIAAIASRYDLMADLVCNHVSDRSEPYRSWLELGAASPYEGMFLTLSAVFPHGARTPEMVDAIERTADDVLLPLVGTTLRSAIADYPATRGLELEGAGLAFSSAKESEDGAWLVLRCVNLTDASTAGRWQLPFTPTEARVARLDETPLGTVAVSGDAIDFAAAARAVVTHLVR